MWFMILIPFLVQSIVHGLDEYYFHLKRGLPRWERIGHPIDTLSVLICLLFVYFVPYSSMALKIYIGLAIFSCVLVTKDEFVHKHHCPAFEHFLHAFLFLNHPIVLTSVALLWPFLSFQDGMLWLLPWKQYHALLGYFVIFQIAVISAVFLYQVIYWNFIWKPTKELA